MKKLFSLVLLIFLIWLFYFYSSYNNFKNQIITNEEKIISIEKDSNPDVLVEKLNISSFWLKLYLRNNPIQDFNAWDYRIEKDANIKTVFENLQNPIFDEITVTILEWWNIYDIDKCLSDPEYFLEINWNGCLYKNEDWEKIYLKKWIIEKWEYIKYVTNEEKIKALSSEVEPPFNFLSWALTLEWFLYPDTYNVVQTNFKINNFVIQQLNNFEEKVINKIEKKYSPDKWQEIVNLASIVEKEEKNPNEKSTVAWILKKRLNEDRFIWADITVCYPYEITSEECKMVVSKYINDKNNYNTRTKLWLPKTPIWNPSFETIYATINSKNSPYYFYLHDTKTWKIFYGKNNAEHEENKRRYIY